MTPRFSLSFKVLAFVALPLFIQISLLIGLTRLQSEAEAELQRANHARRLADAIVDISRDVCDVIADYGGMQSMSDFSTSDDMYRQAQKMIEDDYKELKAISKDDASVKEAVEKSEAAAEKALSGLLELKRSTDRAGDSERAFQKRLWKGMRQSLKEILQQDLNLIGEQQKKIADKSPVFQAEIRKRSQDLLLATGVFDLFVALSAAWFFSRSITRRLEIMTANALRLASNQPLLPAVSGNDEIAILDRNFHRMAHELKQAAAKEQAIIANARDMICTLDDGGRLVSVNPASERILSIELDDLPGRHLIDLVAEKDVPAALDYLERLKSSTAAGDLEIEMRKRDSNPIYVSWSGQWSQEEKSCYLVIHDSSERREAEKLKQEVMAMVTHDLRSPLMTVDNILDFFRRGLYGTFEEKGLKFLDSASRNTQKMVLLINDLLDIEKIAAGMMSLSREPVPLSRCIDTVRQLNVANAEKLAVELICRETDLSILADEERISRVLNNLVSNALKYAPGSTSIEISAESDDDFVLVHVRDQGPGIAEDMQQTIFNRFQQVAGAQGGSGLGLAICKSIVELHGGSIWVESKPGEGSRFSFSIPRAPR